MSQSPVTRSVVCPSCESKALAVVPSDSTIVDEEDDADGKVWTDCRTCGEEFLTYYRVDD
ncbi:hypothetical protein [Halospeciosus flavus]|uniref:Small CPxCG-related zinc finger protein n=1 Tax=Halospeciosus flavus TaxID=3032283 RepID=A0ABD5Z3M8_9EURY|nr:hypothetical protein [Halospeciosus flavus]